MLSDNYISPNGDDSGTELGVAELPWPVAGELVAGELGVVAGDAAHKAR